MEYQPYVSDREKRMQSVLERAENDRKALLEQILTDLTAPDPKVRADAAESLGWLREEECVPLLVNALGDPEEWVRDRATFALSRMKRAAIDELFATIAAGRVTELKGLERALVRMKGGAVTGLLQVLESENEAACDLAVKVLAQLKRFPVERVLSLLPSPSETQNLRLVELLGRAGKTDSLSFLLKLADSPAGRGKKMRRKLRIAFTRIALLDAQACHNQLDSGNLQDASQMLLLHGMAIAELPGLRERVTAFLEHPKVNLRKQALEVLGFLKDPASVPEILNSLSDPAESVRKAAIQVMSKFRRPEFLRGLVSRLPQEKDDEVLEAIEKAFLRYKSEAKQLLQEAKAQSVDPLPYERALGYFGE